MNIPEDTRVYLYFGVRYIELSGFIYSSLLGSPWEKDAFHQNIEYIIDHPNTRKVGTIGQPIDPDPPFRGVIITQT